MLLKVYELTAPTDEESTMTSFSAYPLRKATVKVIEFPAATLYDPTGDIAQLASCSTERIENEVRGVGVIVGVGVGVNVGVGPAI